MTAIFAAAACICAGGWLVEHISLLAILNYIQDMKVPLPSNDVLYKETRWAARRLFSSLMFWRKKR